MTTGRDDCLLNGRLKGEITWFSDDHASVFAHEAGECRFVGTVARKSDDRWSAFMRGVCRSLPWAFDNPDDAAAALLALSRGIPL